MRRLTSTELAYEVYKKAGLLKKGDVIFVKPKGLISKLIMNHKPEKIK